MLSWEAISKITDIEEEINVGCFSILNITSHLVTQEIIETKYAK